MAYLTGNNKVKRRIGGNAIPAAWQIFLVSSSHYADAAGRPAAYAVKMAEKERGTLPARLPWRELVIFCTIFY